MIYSIGARTVNSRHLGSGACWPHCWDCIFILLLVFFKYIFPPAAISQTNYIFTQLGSMHGGWWYYFKHHDMLIEAFSLGPASKLDNNKKKNILFPSERVSFSVTFLLFISNLVVTAFCCETLSFRDSVMPHIIIFSPDIFVRQSK